MSSTLTHPNPSLADIVATLMASDEGRTAIMQAITRAVPTPGGEAEPPITTVEPAAGAADVARNPFSDNLRDHPKLPNGKILCVGCNNAVAPKNWARHRKSEMHATRGGTL